MKKEKNFRIISLECPYRKTVTFRKALFHKTDWERILQRFGVVRNPEEVVSLMIDGEDDYGHLLISITVEE